MGGLVLMIVGGLLLARQFDVPIPAWVFSWEMLIIAVGAYIGGKHSFRNPAWIILVLIGGLFLIDDLFPGIYIGNMIWPIVIIAAGLVMIFKPKKHYGPWQRWRESCKRDDYSQMYESTTTEDTIESVSILGGVKKVIMSKDFKGGEVTCIFGGCELNMMQADINGKAVLEVTQVFGGTRLIVPAHWDIQSEMTAILGSIEDKRQTQKDVVVDPGKILVIKGTSVMGGIDIKSY